MSLYSKLKGISLGLVLSLACAAGAAYAQQTGTAQQDDAPARMQREGRR